jgi:hypothetical protein
VHIEQVDYAHASNQASASNKDGKNNQRNDRKTLSYDQILTRKKQHSHLFLQQYKTIRNVKLSSIYNHHIDAQKTTQERAKTSNTELCRMVSPHTNPNSKFY